MQPIARIWPCLLVFTLFSIFAKAGEIPSQKLMWYSGEHTVDKDYYVAFRGQWTLASGSDCEIQLLAASWFVGWVDGEYFCEGPARFPAAFPEYQTHRIHLPAGHHVLAIEVHHIGETTRILDNPEPFLWCVVREVLSAGHGDARSSKGSENDIPVRWKCIRLEGYDSQTRRVNPELGYGEWCDTRKIPAGWTGRQFVDSSWNEPVVVPRDLGALKPLSTNNTRSDVHEILAMSSGQFADRFGYEKDDPPARFFLADLEPKNMPPQGVWRRYDLGRVRLMRPRFVLNLAEGAVVEFAYSESLVDGRVTPWITLSAGESSNLDHYVARGGEQEFFPLTPKGGRYLEVHIYTSPSTIHFVKEEIVERGYYSDAAGSLQTPDTLLNRIWSVGVNTLRACSEDAPMDNPTRERGQWLADVASVGMEIAACTFSDLQLIRRALIQSARCARPDGLVAGLSPGGPAYLSTFSAQWVTACIQYWQLTGDRSILDELFPYAEKNIEAFEKENTGEGLKASLGWGFVDWGYVPNSGPSDMGVNLHYLGALRDMVRWCSEIGRQDRTVHYQDLAHQMTGILGKYYTSEFERGGDRWAQIGYHRAVLGLKLGFFQGERQKECVGYIKDHMLKCFPNDMTAPRLSDPAANNPRLITPYFAHYAMPLLIEHGEMEFVLEQYRKCWGWALAQDLTTWPEVFDLRWSHCHQWAGSPTWQMSRYLLGLQPRYDLGIHHFALTLHAGSLQTVSGSIPLPAEEGVITVRWSRQADGLHYQLESPVPITLHIDEERYGYEASVVHIEREFEAAFHGIE